MFNPDDLTQFTGTAQYYRHWATGVRYTDGVQYIGANGCGWLVDLIALAQVQHAAHPFQEWTLIADKDSHGFIRCHDGNDNEIERRGASTTPTGRTHTASCACG